MKKIAVSHDDRGYIFIELERVTKVVELTTAEAIDLVKWLEQEISDAEMDQ